MTYAPSTQRSYRTHRDCYMMFCAATGSTPVPASSETLCLYAAMLARSLKYSSVKQYLNVVRLLHLEWGLPNPVCNDFRLGCLLRGVRRDKGDAVDRKLPVTPELLKKLLRHLNLNTLTDCSLWAAALLMFFGMLRRSNVLSSPKGFNPLKSLRRSDIAVYSWGLVVSIRHTKTIQCRERSLKIPLPRIPGHCLCPVQAIVLAFEKSPGVSSDGPAFVVPRGAGFAPLSPVNFVSRIRLAFTRCGVDAKKYAGHSFRRGGASWAYAVGLPIDTIRIIGDWQSQAYTAYIVPKQSDLRQSIKSMVMAIPART